MNLVQGLASGNLDIVGDVHGEYEALCQLLHHLGHDENGAHPQGRSLVFVGDLCDRGPNTPAVLALVQRLIKAGRAQAVLGNHEINLLRDDAKDGAGWYFDERVHRDQDKYAPFARIAEADREQALEFVATLPIALEREDIRVVHACWLQDKIDAIRNLPTSALRGQYDTWEGHADEIRRTTDLALRMQDEISDWPWGLEDRKQQPPLLHARAEHEANKQMLNPLKVLSSGVEQKGQKPFFAGGKWRFADRVAWWDQYDQTTPVVVGHYWRRLHPIDRAEVGKEDIDLFKQIDPVHWHGKHGNVFCVDFSVGGRWDERKRGLPLGRYYKLAALRWPERTLTFDDGSSLATQGFAADGT